MSLQPNDLPIDPTTIRVAIYFFLALCGLSATAAIFLAGWALKIFLWVMKLRTTLLELLAFKLAVMGDEKTDQPGVFARLEQLEDLHSTNAREIRFINDVLGFSDKSMIAAKREIMKRKFGVSENVTEGDTFAGVREHFEEREPRNRGPSASPSPPPPRLPPAQAQEKHLRERSARSQARWDSSHGPRKPPSDDPER